MLNPEQLEAVNHDGGPCLVLAGAGSGKTTVLVKRTARLINKKIAKASEILLLTFTNKAAREMKSRIENEIGSQASGLWAGTFHGFGVKILKTYGGHIGLPKQFAILDASDSSQLVREILKTTRFANKDKWDSDELWQIMQKLRVGEALSPSTNPAYKEAAEVLLPLYLKKLKILGAVDFDGILLGCLEVFKIAEVRSKIHSQIQYMMVDEFQDTNDIQMEFVELLLNDKKNLMIVGDDDQAIYGWRGAKVKNILNFPHRYKGCRTIKLERNYRSSPEILSISNAVIAKNPQRFGKVLSAHGRHENSMKPEVFVLENSQAELELAIREILSFRESGSPLSECAVLYRSNSQGAELEAALRQNQISYQISGGMSFFERKEVKDVLAYLRASLWHQDFSIKRIINIPSRGIGDVNFERLNSLTLEHKKSFYQMLSQASQFAFRSEISQELLKFKESLDQLASILRGSCDANTLSQFFVDLGYRSYLQSHSSDMESAQRKWYLCESAFRIFENYKKKTGGDIADLLENLELKDEGDERNKEALQLMTIHAAKGLEFEKVILLGVEEDFLPHKTLGSNVEEERRLFYVALTRAKKSLILTRCKVRDLRGKPTPRSPSRFLLEIPEGSTIQHLNEFRPITHDQRESLVADFLAKMGK